METLLSKIEALYGISRLSVSHRVEKGFLSENHILRDGSAQYFLKKYRALGTARIQEIHSVKNYFAKGGIPAILPLPTLTGETFFESEGDHYAIFPFVAGIHIERGSYSPGSARALGAMLGKIHTLGQTATIPISLSVFNPWNTERFLREIADIRAIIEKIETKDAFDLAAIKTLDIKERCVRESTGTFADTLPEKLTLIHGDYLDHNVFFNDKNEITHVFDWEKTEYAPRGFELWRCLVYSFITGSKDDLALARTFLDAYRTNAPIDTTELRKGFVAFYNKFIHSLWVETEHYKKNNTRVDHFLTQTFDRFLYITEERDCFVDLVS